MSENLIYISPDWQPILTDQQLNSFNSLWNLDLPAVDEGNQGRGQNGWSQVCIHIIDTKSGSSRRLIIKRQSNYRSRTVRHPIKGISTFLKEYNFIQRYMTLKIPALTPVYCATRQQGKETQVILITEYLDGYQSLAEIQKGWTKKSSWRKRTTIVHGIARLIATLHRQNLEHRCLYPKHIFVATQHDDLQADRQACLIDLETTRWKPFGLGLPVRELSILARRTNNATTRDQILFLRHYLGINKLDANAKKLWRQIEIRINKKYKANHAN